MLWLVALALPLQGLAAVPLISFGVPHDMVASAAAEGPTARNQAAARDDADRSPRSEARSAPKKQLQDAAKFKYSASTACCMSFLPASAIRLHLPQPATRLNVPALVLHVAFVTGGPERPPRSLLV